MSSALSGLANNSDMTMATMVRPANSGISSIETPPKLPIPHTEKTFTPCSEAKKLSSVIALEAT